MTLKFKTPKCLQQFRADQNGTIAIFTAFSIIPLMLFAGAAIDFARLSAAQTHLQSALDASALAGASLRGKTDDVRIQTAQKAFEINMKHGVASDMTPVASFKVVDGVVVATAELEMPAAFMHFAGIEKMNGSTRAEVNILADKKAEIALVLDYSGSMGEKVAGKTKYIVMRDAAKKLVTDLSKSDPDHVKFGLVPFSNHVYTTLPGAFVLGGSGGTWTGCTQDRQHPFNKGDATPTGDAKSKWNQSMYNDPEQLKYGCKGYVDNNLQMLDLTKNFKDVTGKLNVMRPYAYTHIALGVEFGYHLLSPNAPFQRGVAYDDKETKKFMVVLTDGAQTTGAFGESSRTIEDGDKNLAELCTNAKANNITIMTMAFDLGHAPTLERLQNCATDPVKDFFVANDPAALAAAFESIKNAVASEIVLSK